MTSKEHLQVCLIGPPTPTPQQKKNQKKKKLEDDIRKYKLTAYCWLQMKDYLVLYFPREEGTMQVLREKIFHGIDIAQNL